MRDRTVIEKEEARRAADVEQSDREYIAAQQRYWRRAERRELIHRTFVLGE